MSRSRGLALGLMGAGLMLAGCYQHRGSYAVEESEVVAVPAELVVGLVTHSDRGPQQNAFDQPLHTGDRVALVLHLPVARYVYLVNVAPDGSASVLWPADRPTAVDSTVRLPESGWYQLAAPPGLELLGVVATREPIALDAAGKRRLVALVDQADARPDLAKLQSAEPPGFSTTGHASLGIRAPSLALVHGNVHVDASADETVVLLDMDHRPTD